MSAFLQIIDNYLQQLLDSELNATPGEVAPEMFEKGPDAEGWTTWKPIASTVMDAELAELEKTIGYPLPESYKNFLKHKHFYELYIDQASFNKHTIRTWRQEITDRIFDSWPTEYMIDKGYIHFADWSDWGALCFDTTKNSPSANYPVVLWDHEDEDNFHWMANDFESLLLHLDQEAIKNSN